MRVMKMSWVVMLAMALPVTAAAQTPPERPEAPKRWSVGAAAGPTIIGRGYDGSALFGFSPLPRLELLAGIERLHLPFREVTLDDGVTSTTRGGDLTFASGEARVSLLPPDRVSPFVSIGAGAGTSRPTVNATYPEAVENRLRVFCLGGGMRVPIGRSFDAWADARAMVGLEGYDSVSGFWPVRVGLRWRF